ncbi:type VI secretion system lipoprotein TssJ [Achromobacter sp. NPDC058515]|uniref:type VI secretion system lipoprotein TssJ n=1 Tax=Achromobacter sp. NPDC058515 TaxID=3346533 RepID=UPI00364DAC2B
MTRLFPALLATSLLAGCGTVGDVLTKTGQILMDPSIPVGAPEDQPSQIGLSLYAADDVNPNPLAAEEPRAKDADPAEMVSRKSAEGPFELVLKTGSRRELIDSLRGLLGELEEDSPSSRSLSRVDRASSRVVQTTGAPGAAPFDSTQPPVNAVSPYFLPDRRFGAKPVIANQGVTRAPKPLALVSEDVPDTGAENAGEDRGLGQYSQGQSFSEAEPVAVPRGVSTPIAFKVFQLKDDSLLLNADPLQFAQDPKKALGTTFVAQDDYVLLPGQFKYIDFSRIQADTRYVAIVADFHDQNGAVWKQAFRLEPRGRKYALLLTLRGNRVAITDESYRPSQPGSKP